MNASTKALNVRLAVWSTFFLVLAVDHALPEDDYEFPPSSGWNLAETGEDDHTSSLAEGFPGLSAEPTKNPWLEPVDGHGGFDNVAPRLGSEEGPGGLEWDPSPTYRTRYKNGTNYLANTTTTRRFGNNWFSNIPYAIDDTYYNDRWIVRFDANTYRIYDKHPYETNVYLGRFGNKNSIAVKQGSGSSEELQVYDPGGKIFTFPVVASYRCTKIEGYGGSQITFTYSGTTSITVTQLSDGSTAVRKFTYTLQDSGKRVNGIEVAEKDGANWKPYRFLDFTYHDDVTGATGSGTDDLIGIEEIRRLSGATAGNCPEMSDPDDPEDCPAGWYRRNWVFKYYTGSYNSSTNPGYPYQVEAVIGPGSVAAYLLANPTKDVTDIYKTASSSLTSYLERTYEYNSDRRVREIDFKEDCGCGGGSGVYDYTWATTTPSSDLNVWSANVKIDLPTDARRIVDYNSYGQALNDILQEDKTDNGSRRWIRTFRHGSYGQLTDTYSVNACTSYSDSTHVVTTASAGMHYKFAYTWYGSTNLALTLVTLVDPSSSEELYQVKKDWEFETDNSYGHRRRFLKNSEKRYPAEETGDTNYEETTYSYTYHSSDELAVKKRETTLPVVDSGHNGPGGTAVKLYDYFEEDQLHTWSTDGEANVHYTGYDPDKRVTTIRVTDIDTDAADRPSGAPAPPDTVFESSTGVNSFTTSTFDESNRMTQQEGPEFNAWTGTAVTAKNTTSHFHYTKLSDGRLVTLQYPHVDTSYYHTAVSISVYDHDGNLVTNALGELDSGNRDTDFDDDLDESQSTLAEAFQGTIVRRTEYFYSGGQKTSSKVWSDADEESDPDEAAGHETLFTYDSAGRMLTTKTPAGTITRYTYDVLDRQKTRKVGTIDGGGSDNMTLVEEWFYDDEDEDPEYVGDGFLTLNVLHTTYQSGGQRFTDYSYDYRGRVTEVNEELKVTEERDYDNLGRVTETRRYDDSGSRVLLSKVQDFYDAWGQVYETKTFGIENGSGSGFSSEGFWRDKRGLVIKRRYQGKVFEKTRYDGAGRVTNRAVSYDTDESSYAEADDLVGDTVIEETRYALDDSGGVELSAHYQRRHDGTGTGSLTVGGSGNGRAQYTATWYDELHRQSAVVHYGTNDGTDMTVRPTGSPASSGPSTGDQEKLRSSISYTVTGQVLEIADPQGLVTRHSYTDWGAIAAKVENAVDAEYPESDEDRTTLYGYNAYGQPSTITAVRSDVSGSDDDQVTEFAYGVSRGEGPTSSRIASNDLVGIVKFPDPDEGTPGGLAYQADRQYNALGEVIMREDPIGNRHVYTYDERGRLTEDRVVSDVTGVNDDVQAITQAYDALDRLTTVTSYNNDDLGSATVVNQLQFEYGKFDVVKRVWQAWDGEVDTEGMDASPCVTYTWDYPTDGTQGLRQTKLEHTDGSTIIDYVYDSGTDDTISRLSGKKKGGNWLFQEEYLGLDRLVERTFSGGGGVWTLIGEDTVNNDDYVGLDRMGRIDNLVLKNIYETFNHYRYTYNYNSQVTLREDLVGYAASYAFFDEGYEYDGLGRLTDHKRGKSTAWGAYPLFHECWNLDRSGNTHDYYAVTTSTCGASPTWSATFKDSNEYDSWDVGTVEYDGNGNVKEDATFDLIYDAWDRLREVTYGMSPTTIAKYEYNGLHQKIQRVAGGNPLLDYYYNAEGQLVEEFDVEGTPTLHHWYVWGTQYIDDLVVRGPTQEFYFLDENNNVTTRFNGSGTVLARYVYEGYGKPKQLSYDWSTWQSITDDLHLFSGRLYHKDHGHYDYRNRSMDPELLTFLQRDPIGNWGDELNFGNSYTYVANDVVNARDPLGLKIRGKGLMSTSDINRLTRQSLEAAGWKVVSGGKIVSGKAGVSLSMWNAAAAGAGTAGVLSDPEVLGTIIPDLTLEMKLLATWRCNSWAKEQEKMGLTWTQLLPPCPCRIPPTYPGGGAWRPASTLGVKSYHPKASHCIRSKPIRNSSIRTRGPRIHHGQQCCYDASSNLITHGASAGTPDFWHPDWLVNHYMSDVSPYEWCERAGLVEVYLQWRPPNNGRRCAKNP